ncbi:hypothetical protein ACFQ7N_36895 [Streptomyces niveus]|uniref:hypothetical protein n=1 Tax=Streptomyces niveus TaxID=193462 RepID=UPI0036BDB162
MALHHDQMVTLGGRRGVASLDSTGFPDDPCTWLIRFVDTGGGFRWAAEGEVTPLREVFVGMPNDDWAPKFGDPIESWQHIGHRFEEYRTPDLHVQCLFCGQPEDHHAHR